MATKLKGRDLLCLKDFSKEEILEIISFGDKLKMDSMAGKQEHYLEGKSVAMIFQKASTRTRVSFEVAAFETWSSCPVLNANDNAAAPGETISDTAHVSHATFPGIVARVFAHQDLVDLAAKQRLSNHQRSVRPESSLSDPGRPHDHSREEGYSQGPQTRLCR